jgi:hypothetical protein
VKSSGVRPDYLLISSFLWFSAHLCFSATEDVSKGYRIIHTSPQQFVSALYMPMMRGRKLPAKAQQEMSRLSRYFRIKNKIIEGKTVTVEILPDVPLLGTAFEDSTLITVKATLVKQDSTSYLFDLGLKTKLNLVATMTVEPHPSGSLLTIIVKHPADQTFLNSIATKTIFSMGFLSSTVEAAQRNSTAN